jgi:hypothetical protein
MRTVGGVPQALDVAAKPDQAPDEPAALLSGCAGWSVQSFEPRPGFQAAVVAQGSGWQLRHRQVSAPLAQPYAIL